MINELLQNVGESNRQRNAIFVAQKLTVLLNLLNRFGCSLSLGIAHHVVFNDGTNSVLNMGVFLAIRTASPVAKLPMAENAVQEAGGGYINPCFRFREDAHRSDEVCNKRFPIRAKRPSKQLNCEIVCLSNNSQLAGTMAGLHKLAVKLQVGLSGLNHVFFLSRGQWNTLAE